MNLLWHVAQKLTISSHVISESIILWCRFGAERKALATISGIFVGVGEQEAAQHFVNHAHLHRHVGVVKVLAQREEARGCVALHRRQGEQGHVGLDGAVTKPRRRKDDCYLYHTIKFRAPLQIGPHSLY